VIPARSLAGVLPPLALHACAREVDRAVGVLLHTTLDLPDFVPRALALLDAGEVGRSVALSCLAGLALAFALTRLGCERVVPAFLVLLLRPALTLVALASLGARPTYPYGFTLPVALTQDWAIAQDTAALAAAVALLARAPRFAPPRPAELLFPSFLAYALLVPAWARVWEGHPGNEPKYLRMALALGHRLSLDVDGIDAPMEGLPVEPLGLAVPRALGRLAAEASAMLVSLPGSWSAQAIRASRVARQTIRGKDGGVYHVLAPGPSFLLAPLLRADRSLNRASGAQGRLGVSLLVWNALAAGLVAATFVLLRDATGRAGLSAALAGLFGLLPPFVFYPFQFYPEMPGALVLALAFRALLPGAPWSVGSLRRLGLLLAVLPWLHQKFLPVWALLLVWALLAAVERLVPLRALVWLLLPQLFTLFGTALYNFAITGSVRPDALFLAWGPAGVTTDHVPQGFFGLQLDMRYGILPYAPIYLLAAAGLLMPGPLAARLFPALPAALVYYMTVASADDWHGAVSNLGRYVMPIAPLLAACAGVALAGVAWRRGALAIVLALAAWSALLARALWLDPHAANDASRLLLRSAVADGTRYVPDLFVKTLADGAPGLFARIACWALLAALLAAFLRAAARGRAGGRPLPALFGSCAAVLATGLLLERWPGDQGQPRFPGAIELRPGTTAFLEGAAEVERGTLRARGPVTLLVRSRAPLVQVTLLAEGEGRLALPGRVALPVPPGGAWASVPLEEVVTLHGRRGVRETLYRQRFEIQAEQPMALRLQAGE
jgi:hypothetical protein